MEVLDKKRNTSSPGGPQPKQNYITVIKLQDLLQIPTPNAKGILHEGIFQLKTGTEPLSLYNTPSFQDLSFESDGEEDAALINKTFAIRYPGDHLEIREFVHARQDIEVIVLFGSCSGQRKTILGRDCAAMKMRANLVSNNESTHYELTFSNMNNDNIVPGFYDGPDPVSTPFVAPTVALALTIANGVLVQLPSSATAEAVSVASTDLTAGTFVSVLGGGGADPAVISDGAATAGTFILKDGVSFIGLDGARILFEVFENATTTFFIERSRA